MACPSHLAVLPLYKSLQHTPLRLKAQTYGADSLLIIMSKSKPKLYYDWLSVGQSVLVSGTHMGPAANFSLSLFNDFRQLLIPWCGAPSLRRSRVCTFQFLLGIASAAFLRSESHGTQKHTLLSLFSRPPTGRVRYLYFFPLGTG
jgi:hypothetical protein